MEAGIWFERRFITQETKSSKVYVTDDLRIVRIRRGRGTWMISDRPYGVRAGDLALLNNRNPRIFTQIDWDDPIEMEVISVCPQYLFELGFLRLFTGPLGADAPILSGGHGEILELFDRIRAEQDGARMHAGIVVTGLALAAIALLARRYGLARQPEVLAPGIRRALNHLEAHLCERLALSELARVAGMSPEGFSRKFKQCMGIPYAQYVKHKRIAKAIELLESSDATILSIALDCGYAALANFYQAFRSVTGGRPSDYRNVR